MAHAKLNSKQKGNVKFAGGTPAVRKAKATTKASGPHEGGRYMDRFEGKGKGEGNDNCHGRGKGKGKPAGWKPALRKAKGLTGTGGFYIFDGNRFN